MMPAIVWKDKRQALDPRISVVVGATDLHYNKLLLSERLLESHRLDSTRIRLQLLSLQILIAR
jgi:hypothetical protein